MKQFIEKIISSENFMKYDGSIQGCQDEISRLLIELTESVDLQIDTKKYLFKIIMEIKTTSQFAGIYTHLSYAKKQLADFEPIAKLLDAIIKSDRFANDLHKSMNTVDRFNNPVFASVFETELAMTILESAPTRMLEIVNKRIITYCQDFRDDIDQEKLKQQLLKYHLISQEEMTDINPIDHYMALLSRPLSEPRHISEAATLHLIFFNYEHIYQPELELDIDDDEDRDAIHKKVRPKEPGSMFDPSVRGRNSVILTNNVTEFGITENKFLDPKYHDWHTIRQTPHKYRVSPDTNSPFFKKLRSYNTPFIAGFSGTTADISEGIYFLFYNLTKTFTPEEILEYFNLIAAAEIAQGHHSFAEVILPLCNLDLFPAFAKKCKSVSTSKEESVRKEPWTYIDYNNIYEDFMSTAFKNTEAYQAFMMKYPHMLDPKRHEITSPFVFYNQSEEKEEAAKKIQRFFRTTSSFNELKKGKGWQDSKATQNESIHLKRFKKLSKENILKLKKELGTLSIEECNFLDFFLQQKPELTHYTNNTQEIVSSGKILSNTVLNRSLGVTKFKDSSKHDIPWLGNGSFVFFRYELKHDTSATSRFGSDQIIISAEKSQFFQNGWVSMFDMFDPLEISIVNKSQYKGEVVRAFDHDTLYEHGILSFEYNPNKAIKKENFDVYSTIFFGPDIQYGIALAMLRELRRIGGEFRNDCLSNLSLDNINYFLSRVFRVDAKLPKLVELNLTQYRIISLLRLKQAIQSENIAEVEKLLDDDSYAKNIGERELIVAAQCKNFKIFELIMKKIKYANPLEKTDDINNLLLHHAALTGSGEMVAYYIANCKPNFLALNKSPNSILSLAIIGKNIDFIKALKQIDKFNISVLMNLNLNGTTSLGLAISLNNIGVIKALIDLDPTITLFPHETTPLLLLAIKHNDNELIKFVLKFITNLTKLTFDHTNLKGVVFTGRVLCGTVFNNCDLTDIVWNGARLIPVTAITVDMLMNELNHWHQVFLPEANNQFSSADFLKFRHALLENIFDNLNSLPQDQAAYLIETVLKKHELFKQHTVMDTETKNPSVIDFNIFSSPDGISFYDHMDQYCLERRNEFTANDLEKLNIEDIKKLLTIQFTRKPRNYYYVAYDNAINDYVLVLNVNAKLTDTNPTIKTLPLKNDDKEKAISVANATLKRYGNGLKLVDLNSVRGLSLNVLKEDDLDHSVKKVKRDV